VEFEKLKELALECGFSNCGPLEVAKLELREEVREMCKANSCGQYGKRWSCPPGCGELEDMPLTVTVDRERQVITGYRLDMTAVVRQILLASLEQSAAELGLDTKPEEMLEVTAVTTEMTFFDHGLVQPIVIPDAVKTEE